MLRALGKFGIHDIGLKWPNDVQTSQGKLAGILIEAQGDMLGPSVVVIGIGMNQSLTGEMAGRIEQPASSLLQVADELPERNRLFAVLLAELESILETFSLHGFAPMRAEWEQNHRYHGKQARLIATDGTSIVGVVSGVTDSGELRFITGQGEQIFNTGELSLRSELC
jgi:BirA family biotin operon repressor/biotin-[acetyl-CoA-carboxylase] ligase